MVKEERKIVLWLKKKEKGFCVLRRKEKSTVVKEERKRVLWFKKKEKGYCS